MMEGVIKMNVSKLEWIKPELEELNFTNTESGDIHPTELSTTAGPS